MKIVIWGTGKASLKMMENTYFEHIVCFIDNYKKSEEYYSKNVYTPKEFIQCDIEYDYIVIASAYSREIAEQCRQLDIPFSKLIFVHNYLLNSTLISQVNQYQSIENIKLISKKLYHDIEKNKNHVESKILTDRCSFDRVDEKQIIINTDTFNDELYYDNYFRFRTFELVANEIICNNVEGAVAEVGVYRGTFARLINSKFPHKEIYLFDTFEGFNVDEAKEEYDKGRCNDSFVHYFKKTSVDYVLKQMPYPNVCHIYKGLFPDTAVGLEDLRFSFVSIDVDFEKSIYNSLVWFYPRLNKGGYIFIHDYNNSFLEGVKLAINNYKKDFGVDFHMVPLADEGGTLVISK